eukprot:CAMPEP_0202020606 /NCGR_PEP_ID=MMETSP0905-20130828/44855_1 /ASSEMBLY_ACC=CAM_ASM_000554 /TAXON_ID=420261 /ORGANISM="Thalassiosira antarctica, Strain CCMP982" /LENGTH=39 /DNA_ID= /DNA_START= /DNA_END= /DNA_ORIENTATION=
MAEDTAVVVVVDFDNVFVVVEEEVVHPENQETADDDRFW